MKMAVWFSGYKKLLLVLMGLALLGACGSETDEDLTTPALTMDAIDPSTFTKERTLSGQIEAGAGLDVFVSSDAKVGEDTDPAADSWSIKITDLAVGNNLVTVSADDSQGNTRSLQFLLLYEIIKIDQADTVTAQPTSTVHGRLAPEASITSVTLNGDPVVPLPVPENDAFSLLLKDLVPGNNAVKITVQDTEADTQTISFTIVRDENAVSLAIDKPPIPINVQSYRLSGTVEGGVTVAVSVDPDEPPISVSPDATSWQVTISNLKEGDSIITVTAKKGDVISTASAWTRIVVASPIVETEPADLAENVLPDTVLKATFSEAVVASTVNETTFRLTDDQGTPVAGEVAYSAADTSATFTPAASLAPGSYTATLEGIEDPDGNTVNHAWDFTVAVQ